MKIFWNNKLAAILAGASLYAAVEFMNIYVPEKIDDKIDYRFRHILFKLSLKIAKLGASMKYGSEMEIFRKALKFLSSFKLQNDRTTSDAVLVTNFMTDNVPVRIYIPINHDLTEASPVMFYYHGGGYVSGQLDNYDAICKEFSREINIIVISVGYRLAPEFPYPIPIQDCYNATCYALDNMNLLNLNIDTSKVVLAGDSAGANIAAILSIQMTQNGKFRPKAQALIYPPTQYFSFLTPSSIQYSNLELTSRAKLCLLHMGFKSVNKYQEEFLIKNYHTLLLKDPLLKEQFESYLSTDLIPELYKSNRFYYNNYANLNSFVYPSHAEEYDIGNLDPKFVEQLMNLFNLNISPGLCDDKLLRGQPNTLVQVVEHDTRKDEAIIYGERLRLNDNEVEIKYYENGYHGIIMAMGTLVSQRMRGDLIEYVKKNLL